ncbi:TPA: ATP-dependent zinc protease [Candidatus Saccharibacteria bacterium]|nr:ATP-dependent zinc protease [Candidatus Saccharibacteria bacterium]HRJ90681.1 RimK/LysX family protein [Candidatus Saccharibacteria bacterium]
MKTVPSTQRKQASAIIGVSSLVDFAGYKNLKQIAARIDTGARTSSLWATDVRIKNGMATFKLFGPSSPYYTGKIVRRKVVGTREVTSSTGHEQERYVVTMSIRMHGKRLHAKFTLSDRSTQTYPILIGRNTLRGNFLVDSADPGEAMIYKYPDEANEFNETEAE